MHPKTAAALKFPIEHVCSAAGVRVPEVEYYFAKPRQWRFDYAWVHERIALEVEGGIFSRGVTGHTSGVGYTDDCEKYSNAAVMNWCVVRVTTEQWNSGAVIRLVERAFSMRAGVISPPLAKERAVGKRRKTGLRKISLDQSRFSC